MAVCQCERGHCSRWACTTAMCDLPNSASADHYGTVATHVGILIPGKEKICCRSSKWPDCYLNRSLTLEKVTGRFGRRPAICAPGRLLIGQSGRRALVLAWPLSAKNGHFENHPKAAAGNDKKIASDCSARHHPE